MSWSAAGHGTPTFNVSVGSLPLTSLQVTVISTPPGAGNGHDAPTTIPPAPVVTTSGNVTTPATGPNGAVANFTASATDAIDGTAPVVCVPASGSTFPLGMTTVTCTGPTRPVSPYSGTASAGMKA